VARCLEIFLYFVERVSASAAVLFLRNRVGVALYDTFRELFPVVLLGNRTPVCLKLEEEVLPRK
jgi:hypothetical protein